MAFVMDIAPTSVKAEELGSSTDCQVTNPHNFGLSVQAAIGPKVLDGRGLQGRVLIAFSIGSDGSLVGSRIAQSSGHSELDSEALRIAAERRCRRRRPTLPRGSGLTSRPSPSPDSRRTGGRVRFSAGAATRRLREERRGWRLRRER
jgi:TonB family protein